MVDWSLQQRPVKDEFASRREVRARRLTATIARALSDAAPAAIVSSAFLLGSAGLIASPAALAANTYTVNTTGDPGAAGTLSLRQAAALAGTLDKIQFDDSLRGGTISLEQGAIAIDNGFTIAGFEDPRAMTIDGGNADRIFTVIDVGAGFRVDRLHLTHGHSDGCGGAIYIKNSQVSVINTRVDGSSALFGGGICVVGANAGLGVGSNARITSNTAALGGGVYVGNAALSVADSSISGNTATRAGGGLYVAGVPTYPSVIQRGLIAGNSVPPPAQYSYSSQGGGMVISGVATSFDVVATTFAGNSSYGAGSAIRILDAASAGRTRLANVTVAGNVTGANGAVSVSAGVPTIDSSIVANNVGGDLSGSFTVNFSLIRDVDGAQITGSSNQLGADPLLGVLADHGGYTFCMLPAVDSPAIDSGGPGGLSPTDQRLFPLVGLRDMGAAERQYPEDIIFRDSMETR